MMDTLGILAHEINQTIYEASGGSRLAPTFLGCLQPPPRPPRLHQLRRPARHLSRHRRHPCPRTRHHAPRPLHPPHLRARHPGLRTRRTHASRHQGNPRSSHAAASSSASSERPRSSKISPTARPSTCAASPSRTHTSSENHPGTARNVCPSGSSNASTISLPSRSFALCRHRL